MLKFSFNPTVEKLELMRSVDNLQNQSEEYLKQSLWKSKKLIAIKFVDTYSLIM